MHNDTLVHLMHWIPHAHLKNAKALDRPERVVDQMTTSALSATLVMLGGWTRNHFLGLRVPCHNRLAPCIVSCNLIVNSLTMCCCGPCLGMNSAQKVLLLDPAPEKRDLRKTTRITQTKFNYAPVANGTLTCGTVCFLLITNNTTEAEHCDTVNPISPRNHLSFWLAVAEFREKGTEASMKDFILASWMTLKSFIWRTIRCKRRVVMWDPSHWYPG